MREARARRIADRGWQILPVHRMPHPHPLRLGGTHECPHCHAVLLKEEEPSFCCREGKIQLAPHHHCLTAGWRCIKEWHSRQPVADTMHFTAIGVSGEEGFVQEGAPSCVKIHGRTYPHVLPADMRGTVQWYVHDPEERRQEATT